MGDEARRIAANRAGCGNLHRPISGVSEKYLIENGEPRKGRGAAGFSGGRVPSPGIGDGERARHKSAYPLRLIV